MDGFGSHLKMLSAIFGYRKVNSAIEFGMGDFSTPFLIENVDEVISIEMQTEEWYNKISQAYSHHKNWTPIKCIGQWSFLQLKNVYKPVDLVLVDGHGDSRPECINLMQKYTSTIVAHDTETMSYRWYFVDLPDAYKRIDDIKGSPWTTIWTADYGLYEYVKENLKKY